MVHCKINKLRGRCYYNEIKELEEKIQLLKKRITYIEIKKTQLEKCITTQAYDKIDSGSSYYYDGYLWEKVGLLEIPIVCKMRQEAKEIVAVQCPYVKKDCLVKYSWMKQCVVVLRKQLNQIVQQYNVIQKSLTLALREHMQNNKDLGKMYFSLIQVKESLTTFYIDEANFSWKEQQNYKSMLICEVGNMREVHASKWQLTFVPCCKLLLKTGIRKDSCCMAMAIEGELEEMEQVVEQFLHVVQFCQHMNKNRGKRQKQITLIYADIYHVPYPIKQKIMQKAESEKLKIVGYMDEKGHYQDNQLLIKQLIT